MTTTVNKHVSLFGENGKNKNTVPPYVGPEPTEIDYPADHGPVNEWQLGVGLEPDVLSIADPKFELEGASFGHVTGAKHPMRFRKQVGGACAHHGQTALANGLVPAAVGVQHIDWIRPCEKMFRANGIKTLFFERNGDAPGLTVDLPNGTPGTRELYVSRARPGLRMTELGRILPIITSSKLVLKGPDPDPDEESLEVLEEIAQHAACSILEPSPELILHKAFREVVGQFSVMIANQNEIGLLDPNADSLEKRALRLRRVLGDEVDFIITPDGHGRGLAWSEGHWWPFDAPVVNVVSTKGAGDVFAAEFGIQRFVRGLPTPLALAAAVEFAASWVAGQLVV